MSIINNSHAIGVDTRNLVLKTRGTLHVKVGDRYYELDFRNLEPSKNISETKEEVQHIITVSDKQTIENLEYPGDNKLIIGTSDGSLFVSSQGMMIDITPKTVSTEQNEIVTTPIETPVVNEITTLNNVYVSGLLDGDCAEIDFANGSISTDYLKVNTSFSYPRNTVTNNCCKTSPHNNNYESYDFIELEDEELKTIVVKHGVMVKSNIIGDVLVKIDGYESTVSFENGTYVIYTFNGELVPTKLN